LKLIFGIVPSTVRIKCPFEVRMDLGVMRGGERVQHQGSTVSAFTIIDIVLLNDNNEITTITYLGIC